MILSLPLIFYTLRQNHMNQHQGGIKTENGLLPHTGLESVSVEGSLQDTRNSKSPVTLVK